MNANKHSTATGATPTFGVTHAFLPNESVTPRLYNPCHSGLAAYTSR